MTTQQTTTVFEQKLKGLEQVADSRDEANDGVRDTNRKADAKGYEAVYIYATSTDKERVEHDDVIKIVSGKRNIRFKDGTPQHNKITRLSLGKDKSQTSDKTKCFNAALVDGIDPEGYVVWIEDVTERVIKATRHMDGTVRKDPRPLSPNKKQKTDLINRGNAELNNKVIAKVKIKDLDKPPVSTDCVMIGVQHPNGTIEIKAVLMDEKLSKDAYASYAKSLPELTEDEQVLEDAQELLEHKIVTMPMIQAKLGKEVAEGFEQAWHAQHSKYEASEGELHPDIIEALRLQRHSDRLEALRPDSGSDYNILILMMLNDLQDKGVQISHLYDREVDITTNCDAESMPRLLTSKSMHSLKGHIDNKTRVYKDFVRDGLADYLKARKEVEPELTAAQIAHMQQMRAMVERVRAS